MSAASSSDEQFMATISHELRGPLHAVLGLSEVLMASDLSSGDAQLAASLHREANAMAVLVDDVIAYGQFSSTTPSLKDAPFAPRMLVTSVVDRLRSNAHESGLQLLVEFDPRVPLRVLGDAVRFGQVVGNLVSNAIRYTETGSVHVTLTAVDDTLSVHVRDTGVGMNPDDLQRIFEPFVRVSSSAVRGTGLGLAVVNRICEVMGGRITVDSTPGAGTTFVFSVPCRPAIDAAEERHERSSGAQGNVLIVDDSEINRTLALKQLEILGLSAVAVESGEQALDLLEEDSVDLILMDWNLPGISGLETAEAIRKQGLISETVPIIAMTANVLAGDSDACLAAGMNDHLGKPVSLDDIRQMMNLWLEHESADRVAGKDAVEDSSDESIQRAIEGLVEDLGDVDTVRIVVETYLNELTSRRTLLLNTAQNSAEEQRRAAHTLCSTSALVGADKLAELCRQFESDAEPDSLLRRRLADEIDAVQHRFTQLLDVGVAS